MGGHVGAGEDLLASAIRETREELGIRVTESDLTLFGVHVVELPCDRERVTSWTIVHEGPFAPDSAEVDRVVWFDRDEIDAMVARGECTPHFAIQWRSWLATRG